MTTTNTNPFAGEFMQPHVERGSYFAIETTCGTEVVPADLIGRTVGTHVEAFANYIEGKPLDEDEVIECKDGWLARMSAPGYLDCTSWSAFASEAQAMAYLIEMYGNE